MNHDPRGLRRFALRRRRPGRRLVMNALARCAEHGEHLVGFKSLTEQIAEQALKLFLIGDAFAAAKAFVECCREERLGIELAVDLIDGAAGGGRRDAGALDTAIDAQPATAVEGDLGPGNRLGDADIVDRAFRFQARNREVDVFWPMSAAEKTLADLGF